MRRAALAAGVSLAALLMVGPKPVLAWPSDSWWGGARVAPAPKASKPRSRSSDSARKSELADKTPPIPPGPLHIIVSIDKQRATLFADGAPVASTAISTGTASHPTPMGVFTIIQKSRHHVSNLYGAAMPYMQRITWSGSALHQGPLPGYPASHGCVRLTESFAQLLWKATKMGARVVITRPEVAPAEFEHARLFVAAPRVADVPLPQPAPMAAAAALAAPAPVAIAPVAAPAPVAPPPRLVAEPATTAATARIRTADAGSAMAVAVVSVVGDDAKAAVTSIVTEPLASKPALEQPTKLSEVGRTDGTAKPAETPAEAVASTPDNATDAVAALADKSIEAKPAEAPEPKPAGVAVAEVTVAEPPPAKPATVAAPAPIIVDERPKTMPPAVVQEANGRPISVFVSRKEGKLYVRQGWKPLFNAPVTFEQPEQPIGTHVYTAMNAKADGTGFRWTVVSIPSGYPRLAELKKDNGRTGRSDKPVPAVFAEAPMPSPAAALDRMVLPPQLVERISELMTPGSSLIVSDNKLSDETGDYTDFIVLTR
jgi:hypothetical protein